MYYYIVDPQKLSQREFERVQNLLYSSLSEYRVSGEIMRVTGLRTINQLVENAFTHGAKTIVAVGSDETLHDVINAIKGREIVVGFIPLFNTELGELLGIKNIEQAAKTIGARRIAVLDLGNVNNTLFLSKLFFGLNNSVSVGGLFNYKIIQSLFNLPSFEVKFSVNNQYSATSKVIGGVVSNKLEGGVAQVKLLPELSKTKILQHRGDILTGAFENIPSASIVQANKIEVSSPPGLPLRVGNRVIAKTPATIEIVPQALKIIVGKERKF